MKTTLNIVTLTSSQEKINNEMRFIIKIFGKTSEGKNIYLRIINYTPYFHVKIPIAWSKAYVDLFVRTITKKIDSRNQDGLDQYDIVTKKEFYGFTNNESNKYVRLIFKDVYSMMAYEKVIGEQRITVEGLSYTEQPKSRKYDLYESDFDPLLRFVHIRKIMTCGWISIDNQHLEELDEEQYVGDLGYEVEWFNIHPVDNASIAKWKIMSFDIECDSPEDGLMPQANRKSDKIIGISATFSYYPESECYYKHYISLGTCDPIPGCTVECAKDEEGLLLLFKELILKHNPDVITGYNIFGFDSPYIYNRTELLDCKDARELSRIPNYNCKMIEKKTETKAFGENNMYYLDMIGRVQIDLYKTIQRGWKLIDYKLDSVISHFINEGINEIKVLDKAQPCEVKKIIETEDESDSDDEEDEKEDTKMYNVVLYTNPSSIKIGDYIVISYDDGIAKNTFAGKNKFRVLQTIKYEKEVDGKKGEIRINVKDSLLEELKYIIGKKYKEITWAQVKDDLPPREIFRLFKGSSKDRATIGEYCVKDSEFCNRLIAKLQILTHNIGMANVCYVPLQFIFLRGQSIKGESLVFRKCRELGYLIKTNYKPRKRKDEKKEEDTKKKGVGYPGAYVFDPTVGVYFSPISVLDYSSLYPKSMIAKNMSHECLVTDSKYDNLDGYFYYRTTVEYLDGTIARYKFARKNTGERGIIPQILMELLDARERTKKQMKGESDPFLKNILDGLQLSFKVTANSLYGIIGSKTSKISCIPIAASTTSTGKVQLQFAKDIVEKAFPESKVIYGDSVSADTPVIIKQDGEVLIKSIDSLTNEYDDYKGKEYGYVDAKIWTDSGWTNIERVIRHKTEKTMYRVLTHTGCVDVTEDHSLLTNEGNKISPKEVKVGMKLLHSFPETSVIDKPELTDKVSYQKMYYYLTSLGFNVKINRNGELECVEHIDNPNAIQQITCLGTNTDYVYDLQTTNHHFSAGIGRLIVHNTDSIFINFNIKDEKGNLITNKDALQKSIDNAKICAKLINEKVPPPHEIVYEKTFWPYWIKARKMYYGNKYETDVNKFQPVSMGIVLKRRDGCTITREILGRVIDIVINKRDVNGAIEFVKTELRAMLNGKYAIDKFIISKTLKSKYNLKMKKDGKMTDPPAHRVLADRMGERDPGNKPLANDRIPYVYIRVDKNGVEPKDILQGNRIEHPEYVKEHKLKIDYIHYIEKQIMKPVVEFLDVMMPEPQKLFDEVINEERNRRRGIKAIENFFPSNKSESTDKKINMQEQQLFSKKEKLKMKSRSISDYF